MSQSQIRPFDTRREFEDEVNQPLIKNADIPSAPTTTNSTNNNTNAARSFPQSSYNTFIEQQQNKQQTRTNKPKLPMRTTKISQKLKLFPEDELLNEEETTAEEAGVYTQIAKIPHGVEREEAEMLNKMDRSELSRMTAYCTAS